MRGSPILIVAAWLCLARADGAAPPQAVLDTHCVDYHGPNEQKGKVNLAGLSTRSDLALRALEQIDSGRMPPKDEEPLADEDKAALTRWLRSELAERQRREGRSKL